ncbi:MAG: hypothetical protein OXU75_07125 [Deltaproteobacteria bacterium]|nr:hypothetical protein [Deltaproteobacteria bacterium]
MVSAMDFCDAFTKQWKEDIDSSDGHDAILDAYKYETPWTEYMLAGERPFLRRLLKKLPSSLDGRLMMGREWYTLDAVYYEEGTCIYRPPKDGGPYPDCLHVIIEHENAGDVETEMWKLLMFRSPLKVLIFYDYRDDCKKTDEKKEKWLAEKVSKLFEMGRAVERRWSEADNVEYLFLVGNRSEEGQIPCWRYLAVKPGGFKQPPGEDCFQPLC